MSKSKTELPTGPLRDLFAWWRKAKVKGLIIGGLAVGFLGRPRTTLDVDAIVLLDQEAWPSFLKAGEAFSFFSRLPDPLVFAQQNRMLLLHHRRSRVDVDLSLGGMPFELGAVERARKVRVGRLSVPIPTVEDLIVLKAVANRDRDKVDIADLLEAFPDLDASHIRKHIDEFAQILELPEIYEDLDRMLVEHRKKHRAKRKK